MRTAGAAEGPTGRRGRGIAEAGSLRPEQDAEHPVAQRDRFVPAVDRGGEAEVVLGSRRAIHEWWSKKTRVSVGSISTSNSVTPRATTCRVRASVTVARTGK